MTEKSEMNLVEVQNKKEGILIQTEENSLNNSIEKQRDDSRSPSVSARDERVERSHTSSKLSRDVGQQMNNKCINQNDPSQPEVQLLTSPLVTNDIELANQNANASISPAVNEE